MYIATGQKRYISKVESMGGIITLNDRSKWKIGIMDKTKSMMWMMTETVIVNSYMGNKYKITHENKNETVEAEFIAK